MAQYFEWIILYVSPNLLALVAQNMNKAIRGIRHDPVDKYKGKEFCYKVDSDQSSG